MSITADTLLKVEKGNAAPEELAAITAILLARAAATPPRPPRCTGSAPRPAGAAWSAPRASAPRTAGRASTPAAPHEERVTSTRRHPLFRVPPEKPPYEGGPRRTGGGLLHGCGGPTTAGAP
ncbi:hypothetical protein GCM10020254_28160 [Streptomyces goshikiensis]